MKILSIDWDYFINCSYQDRLDKFPDGGNETIGPALSKMIWTSRYSYDRSIEAITVRKPELEAIKKIINSISETYLFIVADSHKHLGSFLLDDSMKDKLEAGLEIVNIDHHHDMYGIGDDLNCGNWLNKVVERYPETKVRWISNEDSDFIPNESENITRSVNLLDAKGTYDIIYLCRSGVWSPMHLDKEFGALNRFIKKRANIVLFQEEIENRWDTESQKEIATMRKEFKKLGLGD